MNSKQRKQHQKRGIRMAKEMVKIASEMVDDLEKGKLTYEEARKQLFVAKAELSRM